MSVVAGPVPPLFGILTPTLPFVACFPRCLANIEFGALALEGFFKVPRDPLCHLRR